MSMQADLLLHARVNAAQVLSVWCEALLRGSRRGSVWLVESAGSVRMHECERLGVCLQCDAWGICCHLWCGCYDKACDYAKCAAAKCVSAYTLLHLGRQVCPRLLALRMYEHCTILYICDRWCCRCRCCNIAPAMHLACGVCCVGGGTPMGQNPRPLSDWAPPD